mmetsp:Transcript_3882/g.5223  ORF Transcript_3882/g.5223 Transcript_3882/m.5223 type:complete len:181 (+) Transcript_3882:177-719(+)
MSSGDHDHSNKDKTNSFGQSATKALLKKIKKTFKKLNKSKDSHDQLSSERSSPDFLTQKEKWQLRGFSVCEDAETNFDLGVDHLNRSEYENAQIHLEKALRAHLVLNGADHRDVMKTHQKLGEVAMKQGDEKKAAFHFDIVERRKKTQQKQAEKSAIFYYLGFIIFCKILSELCKYGITT